MILPCSDMTSYEDAYMKGNTFPKSVFGFNVIGFVSSNCGLGTTARNVCKLLVEKNIPITVVDMDPGIGRYQYDITYATYVANSWLETIYPINLIILPPDVLVSILETSSMYFQRPEYLNAAWCVWEIPALRQQWIESMQQLDVLIGQSDYIRDIFDFNVPNVLKITAAHPLYLPEHIYADRPRFGLAEDAIIFITSFDPHSDVQRKNPWGTIEAFERGLGTDSRARLVIKVHVTSTGGKNHPVIDELHGRCDGNPNITINTENYSYLDILSLYASCDVYVSLHRAEGLGLGPMEAMRLGKPVIATAWSGNMTYMNHTNSCLVGYGLVPVVSNASSYDSSKLSGNAIWANPIVDNAAAWMRRLVEEPNLRAAIGRKALLDLDDFQVEARQGLWIDELKAIWKRGIITRKGKENGLPYL